MIPSYDLEKIKFAVGGPTFEKAVVLYEEGKVAKFRKDFGGFSAKVAGSKGQIYNVSVSAEHYDCGDCNCYLGQNDELCKHMVAVAIQAVMDGKKLSEKDKQITEVPKSSGKLGELDKQDLSEIKKKITEALRYVKAYSGPSRTWFAYQNSLSEGCARLSALISEFPVSGQTAELLVDMLLRLDKKVCSGGVDDSDGAVGGFMEEVVNVLQEYTKLEPNCVNAFETLKGRETCFGWEESLLKILSERHL
jgi:hypothetical protein